ncbi:ankyrin repeat-containing domain protein [Chaetomium sp. MPI-CAGE-AT-0009]|nr:ankyrin repeat-containing domain protein [Chaetomium sp. MPI-CAGE-AT-0009]
MPILSKLLTVFLTGTENGDGGGWDDERDDNDGNDDDGGNDDDNDGNNGGNNGGNNRGDNDRKNTPFVNWLRLFHSYGELPKLILPGEVLTKLVDAAVKPYNPLVLACIWGFEDVLEVCPPTRADFASQPLRKETFLSLAARYQEQGEPVLRALLDKKADINEPNTGNGRTAIYSAAASGRSRIVQFLMARDANVFARDTTGTGSSLLVMTAEKCDNGAVSDLLERWEQGGEREKGEIHEAFVSACGRPKKSETDSRPSRTAGFKVDVTSKVVSLLLDRLDPGQTMINVMSRNGKFALTEALDTENYSVVRSLLRKKAKVEMVDGSGKIPLQICALRGNKEIAERLLKKGAKISREGGAYGSAIHAAITGRHLDMLKFLIRSSGANPNVSPRTSPGDVILGPPLFYSIQCRWKDGVTFLLRDATLGIDINQVIPAEDLPAANELDPLGQPQTALQAAIKWRGQAEVVQELLDRKAAAYPVSGLLRTETEFALRLANEEVVKLFLSRELMPAVNESRYKWGTALQTALESHLQDVHATEPPRKDLVGLVKLLLEQGADVSLNTLGPDPRNPLSSALESAACGGDVEIFTLLLDKNPVLESRETRYGGALAAAASGITTAPKYGNIFSGQPYRDISGHIQIINLLLEKKADINAWGKAHATPLDHALDAQAKRVGKRGGEEMIWFLQEMGAKTYREMRTAQRRRRALAPNGEGSNRSSRISSSSLALSIHHPPDKGLLVMGGCLPCCASRRKRRAYDPYGVPRPRRNSYGSRPLGPLPLPLLPEGLSPPHGAQLPRVASLPPTVQVKRRPSGVDRRFHSLGSLEDSRKTHKRGPGDLKTGPTRAPQPPRLEVVRGDLERGGVAGERARVS